MTNDIGKLPSPSEPELSEALARYLAGESPPEEEASVEAWLEEDPTRRQELTALESALSSLRLESPPDLDVEAALREVSGRLDEPQVLPFRKRAPREPLPGWTHRTFIRVAAAVVLLLGGTLLWRAVIQRNEPGAPLVAGPLAFATQVGQSDTILLADGTQVLLGPGSRLTAAAGYGDSSREVQLDGIALFRVVHDESRPFSVRAGAANVRDLGTVFTVSGGDGERVRVVVTDGSVSLGGVEAALETRVTLEAGDRAVLEPGSEPVVQRGAATGEDLAWTTGRLVLDDESMAQVAVELSRWYGLELRFGEPELAQERLTATFQGESVAQVLDAIALSLGVDVERSGNTAVLRSSLEP